MTDTEFLQTLPQREFPRGFTRPLTGTELSRLREIASQKLPDAACVHTPTKYGNAHEARMLLATI
jgi:hypothetical protein